MDPEEDVLGQSFFHILQGFCYGALFPVKQMQMCVIGIGT
jgi:hypothetical protein